MLIKCLYVLVWQLPASILHVLVCGEKNHTVKVNIATRLSHQMILPLAYQRPTISLCTAAIDPIQSAVYGNVLNPAYMHTLFKYLPQPLSFINRVKSLLTHVIHPLVWRHLYIVPKMQAEVSKAAFFHYKCYQKLRRCGNKIIHDLQFDVIIARCLLYTKMQIIVRKY